MEAQQYEVYYYDTALKASTALNPQELEEDSASQNEKLARVGSEQS